MDEFYRHPQTSDGRLGKCKSRTRQDVTANRTKRREEYAARDRQRNQRPARKASKRAQHVRWRELHPEKRAAQNAANNAVRDGLLERQPCEVCGSTKGVEKHHEDYSKPLEVRWLCVAHHKSAHREAA